MKTNQPKTKFEQIWNYAKYKSYSKDTIQENEKYLQAICKKWNKNLLKKSWRNLFFLGELSL